jgi:DNA transformation protein and related proteins
LSGIDPEYLADLFSAFGPVSVRRMFGGAGLFAEGLMIGLVSGGVIYLKADEQTIPAFEREGLGPFSYKTKTGSNTINSYWRMPERLYDDPEELAQWARQALGVAQRNVARKAPSRRVAKTTRSRKSRNRT